MFKRLCVSLLVIFMTACAAKYKAAEEGVAGYRDLQIEKNVFYVEYTESENTSWEQIHQFALKRCGEIAKAKGYDYFDVISKKQYDVYLETDVDQITVSSMGNLATDPPVTHSYKVGGHVEGRRVTYKIKLMKD